MEVAVPVDPRLTTVADFDPPPPVWIDPEAEWLVWTTSRSKDGFARWTMMPFLQAIRWGQMPADRRAAPTIVSGIDHAPEDPDLLISR